MQKHIYRGLTCGDRTASFKTGSVDVPSVNKQIACARSRLAQGNWLARVTYGPSCMRTVRLLLRTCTIKLVHKHTSNPALHLWKSAGVSRHAANSFPGHASEAIPSQWGGKGCFFLSFFNGEKWEAGEELAVAGPGNWWQPCGSEIKIHG